MAWYGGQRKIVGVFSCTTLWYTPGLPPLAIRFVLVCNPEGKRRKDAFFCTEVRATPSQMLQWVIRRWSVEVTLEEARARLSLETQRHWSDQAIVCTMPVLLVLFSIITVLALLLNHGGHMPVQGTAWYHRWTFPDQAPLSIAHQISQATGQKQRSGITPGLARSVFP